MSAKDSEGLGPVCGEHPSGSLQPDLLSLFEREQASAGRRSPHPPLRVRCQQAVFGAKSPGLNVPGQERPALVGCGRQQVCGWRPWWALLCDLTMCFTAAPRGGALLPGLSPGQAASVSCPHARPGGKSPRTPGRESLYPSCVRAVPGKTSLHTSLPACVPLESFK